MLCSPLTHVLSATSTGLLNTAVGTAQAVPVFFYSPSSVQQLVWMRMRMWLWNTLYNSEEFIKSRSVVLRALSVSVTLWSSSGLLSCSSPSRWARTCGTTACAWCSRTRPCATGRSRAWSRGCRWCWTLCTVSGSWTGGTHSTPSPQRLSALPEAAGAHRGLNLAGWREFLGTRKSYFYFWNKFCSLLASGWSCWASLYVYNFWSVMSRAECKAETICKHTFM